MYAASISTAASTCRSSGGQTPRWPWACWWLSIHPHPYRWNLLSITITGFTTSGLELLVDIPSGINLKKQVVHNLWSAGRALTKIRIPPFTTATKASSTARQATTPSRYEAAWPFEYALAQKLMLSLGGGITTPSLPGYSEAAKIITARL